MRCAVPFRVFGNGKGNGKGKGNPEKWVAVVKPGKVIFELEGVAEDLARAAFIKAHHKLPIKTQVISREPLL